MTPLDDAWFNEGIDEAVEKAEQAPINGAQAPSSAPQAPIKQPAQVLSKLGIGRGGVIRNPTTKRKTQSANPVTNPRPPSKSNVREPTPREEALALNPALAIPSVLTGMDVDIDKPQPAQPLLSYDMTLRQMIEHTVALGGSWNFGNQKTDPKFTIQIQVTSAT